MDNANLTVDAERITTRPRLGTGWETILNHMDREITMQLKILSLRLPLKRRFPYSQVVRVGQAFRQTWWSQGMLGQFRSPIDIIRIIICPTPFMERVQMPLRGFRYDILVTVKGGKTIRLGTVNSPDIANEIERQCKQRLRLSET